MADETYQQAHLGFVTNNYGTTHSEILLVIIIPQLVVLVQALHSISSVVARWRPIFDFIFIILPQLCFITVLNNYSSYFSIAIYLLCATICVQTIWRARKLDKVFVEAAVRRVTKSKNYLNVFRGGILILTVMCILAVDFPAFPRRFAKTEIYGFGLMDIGIGLFFVTNGIVSPEARGLRLNVITRLKHLFTSSVPLLVLGFGRPLLVAVSGYHNPVSEYGVHWNFFLSLAVVKVLAAVAYVVISPKFSLWLAVIVVSAYQWLLCRGGLTEFIMDDVENVEDNDMYRYFYDNRSGICSCIGGFGIYLIAVRIGQFIFLTKRDTYRQCLLAIGQLYGMWIGLTIAFCWMHEYVQPVSRKLNNFTFVLWVTAFTAHMLAILLTGDLFTGLLPGILRKGKVCKPVPYQCQRNLFQYVNQNGLFYFLTGNITTGVVNMSMKTIYATPPVAFFTMVCYLTFTFLLVIKKHRFYEDRKIKSS